MPEQTPLERLRAQRAARGPRPPRRSWFGSVVDSASDYGEGVWETTRDMATGLATFGKDALLASHFNPDVGSRLSAAQRTGNNVLGMVEPITEQMSRPENAGMFGQFGGFGKGLAEIATGIPFRQVAGDFEKGEYAKGLGHATPGAALLGLGGLAARAKSRPPAPVPPPKPAPRQLTQFAGPSGTGGGSRFVQGPRGVADALQPNVMDVAPVQPNFRPGQGTVLPQERNMAHPVPPDIAATYSGAGDLPPVRNIRSSAGIDPLRSSEAMAFEALVPNRYKVADNFNPIVGEVVDQPRPTFSPFEDPRPMPSDPTHWSRSPIFDNGIGEVAEVGAPPPPPRSVTRKPVKAQKAPKKQGATATQPLVPEVVEAPPQAAQSPAKPAPKRTADRPYATVSDVDLQTLAKIGDSKAIAEIAARKEAMGGFHIADDGMAVEAPSFMDRLKETLTDQSGSVPRRPKQPEPDLGPEFTPVGDEPPYAPPSRLDPVEPVYQKVLQQGGRGPRPLGESAPSFVDRLKSTLKDESGSVPLPQLKKIDFDAPIDAGGGKGNIFHRTVNKVFDRNFANWVNARRATNVEGLLKSREFADLNKAGMEGIHAFQAGIKSGRFKDVSDYFTKKHQQLSETGVRLGFRENYLPQLWDNTADEVFQVSKRLGLKPQFTLERVLENYQAGIEAGLKPKFQGIGELIGWYEQRANKAIADRQFFDHLRESKQILPRDKAPQDWVTLNPDHFPVQKFKTPRGEKEVLFKAPKSIADAINNYLGEGHEFPRWIGDKAALTKNIILSAGVPKTGINAHGLNLAVRHVMGRGLVRGGAEAAKYIVNPKTARRWLDENLAKAPEFVKEGLVLTTEDHIIGQSGSKHLLREPKTKVGKVANKGLNKLLEAHGKLFEDPLFQNIVPAMKLKHASGLADDFMKQGMSRQEAVRAASEATNNLYGGINWEAMQRSRDLQNLLRGVILAPDWFETQYRIGKGMTKTLLDPKNPRGVPYKRAAANLIGAYVMANVVNMGLNDGKPMWENPPGHALDIQAGKVGGKVRYIRPFGTAADFARLPFDTLAGALQGDLSSPSNILKNRRSTIARLGSNLIMNQDDFGSPIYGNDKFGRKQPIITQIGKAAREVGEVVTPQYLSGPIDYATGRATSAEEAVLGSVEMPVRYSRASTKRRSRSRPVRRRASR